MAEGGTPPELDLHLLECPICLERLQQPKSLPCLHSYCQDCLGAYITKELSGKMTSATSFPCPVCRRMTSPVNPAETKDKWAEQFPTNSVIQDLILLKERSSDPLYCGPCQKNDKLNNPAQFWCKSMNENFCKTCKLKLHDLIHIDCGIVDITVNDAPRCDQHDKKIVWYCEDHQLLGCNVCVFKDHRSCEEISTVTEYFLELKSGTKLKEMQAALEKGAEVMESLVKDFDEQLKTMAQNHENALQSTIDLREKDITDELTLLFKEETRNKEESLRQCERLMNGMLNTLKSSIKAVEEKDIIETIVLYQRGKTEVESCKTLVSEMSKSFMSVSIQHQIVPGHDTISENAMGKIVVGEEPRHFPCRQSGVLPPLLERSVTEVGRFKIKTPSDDYECRILGVVYLPCAQIVVSDNSNTKLKLFTDKGQYLDELTVRGYPMDMCLVDNNTVAVAVDSPGGVLIVKVNASKLSLSSQINMPHREDCCGITHRDGRFVVSSGEEVYSVTQDGTSEMLCNYNVSCWSLTRDPIKGDILVSVDNNNPGDVAVSRLSADKRRTNVMNVGVMRGARGIDVDREGNIYVCGFCSHNVVQMSGDGTHVRELLTSSDGMVRPWEISVCGDTFVVTNYSDTDEGNYVRVFQLY